MSTAPIIHVSSIAPGNTAAGKASSSSPTDQSFGQVLSREVNGQGNSGGNASGASVNGSQGGNSMAASSASAKSVSSKSADDKQSTTGSTDSASASVAAGSAQILALVANVQQTGLTNGGTPTANSAPLGSANGTAAVGVTAQNASNSMLPVTLDSGKSLNQYAALAADESDSAAAESDSGQIDPAANMAANIMQDAATKLTPNPALTSVEQLAKHAQSNPSSVTTELPATEADASVQGSSSTAQPALDLSIDAAKDNQVALTAIATNAIATPAKIEQTQSTALPVAAPPQAVSSTQIPGSNPDDKLTPAVGSPGWDQAVGQKVVWMVAGGQQSASLTLNPPDLGPMQVVLNVSNSHATVTFTAAQPEVRQALEAAIPKLREILGDVGIQLGQTAVNSGSAQQQNFSANQTRQNSGQISNVNATDAVETTNSTMRTVASAGIGLVDTFA